MGEPRAQVAIGLLPPKRQGRYMEQLLSGGQFGYADAALASQPANGSDMNTPSARNGRQRAHYSRESAVAFVISAIESTGAASRNDFDVDQIVSTAHAMADDWDMEALQPDAFWRIAATFIKQ